LLVARLIERDADSLTKIGARLSQKDYRFGGFELGEKEPVLPALASPIIQQVDRGARRARIIGRAPFLNALADQINPFEGLPYAARLVLSVCRRRLGIAIPVARLAPARPLLGNLASSICQCAAGSSYGEFRIGSGTS
jgi:hypothetical protein